MPAPEQIKNLIERFNRNRETYLSGKYNETQIRHEFIDPFFIALGWDVNNTKGYAEAYKDVIHEDSIKIGSATKAPDYCFRVGGNRKFFIEAKKPAVNLKESVDPAFQLRRYAWSAKLPLSILTDFEEFAVYDCRIRPLKNDKPGIGRTMYIKYTEYPDRWDEIAGIFSLDAILKGSFDKYAVSKRKKGTQEVDSAFLNEIENWRDLLARNIALRNQSLSNRELNFAVQRTIDRIIFLRICEDRGIEPYGKLQALLNGTNTYRRLLELFYHADNRYNSGLFHFNSERDRTGIPDDLTPALFIDDKILKDIIKALYPPSPYEFSVFPAEILGQVYEQFLGKVITLTPSHRAKVEEKPEVKKAGGVYYTPAYIVDYIVENTVGKLLEKKTTNTASKLKILDPACGSGSFLIGAFQYLLDWHLKYYTENNPEKHRRGKSPKIYQAAHSDWRLTTDERKRILLNNIYGVDIDTQAVEVTKLSLLLKVLEGETRQTIENQLSLFHQRALPDLGSNIKCGNSLIGPDFYDGAQLNLFDDEERYRINVFDWKTEFKEIMGNGGFDAVIGNPPYRMLQPHNTKQNILDYLKKHYLSIKFKIDLFHLFFQQGVSLLRNNGYHGYIVPATILNNVHAEDLRIWLMEQSCIESISVASEKVFSNADVHTSVIILHIEENHKKRQNHKILTTSNLSKSFVQNPKTFSHVKQDNFSKLPGNVWNILINDENVSLITRLNIEFTLLKEIGIINRGLITGDRAKFFSKEKESKAYIPIIAGADVHRYFTMPASEFVFFERPDSAGGCWDPQVHLAPHKLVVRQIGFKPTASILREPIAVTGNIFTIRISTIEQELYVLGILNSLLIEYFWKIMFSDFKKSFPQVTIFSLSQIPIHISQHNDPTDKACHDKMVGLVEEMIELHKKLAGAKTAHEKTMIQRQIDMTDRQIDKLVYELYDLTDDEIAIVEKSVNK